MAGWASMSRSKFVLFPKDSLVCLYISVIQFLPFFFFFQNYSKAYYHFDIHDFHVLFMGTLKLLQLINHYNFLCN